MMLLALLLLPTEDAPAEPPPFPQDGIFTITVVAPDGRPIEGATIDPWALRMGGGHGAWHEPAYGPKPTPTTGPDGVATFTVPTRAVGRKLETVSATVQHPEFVPLYEHVDAGEALVKGKTYEAKLTMRRGTKLRIEVVALDGKVDPAKLNINCPGAGTGELPFTADGTALVTHPGSDDSTLLRVTGEDADGNKQFGDWIAWSPGVDGSTELTAVLQTGLTVRGRLSKNVPRPVKRGWVVCDCTTEGPTYDHRRLGQTDAAVAEDGTFVLKNIPHGCDMQIAAICEGFTSEPPDEKTHQRMLAKYDDNGRSRDGGFVHMPWVTTPPEDGGPVVVPMREAATLLVSVRNPDGTAAPGVVVATSPNDHAYGLGNWAFANKGMPAGYYRKPHSEWPHQPYDFSVEMDEEGVATIRHLPPSRQSVSLFVGDWQKGTGRELSYEGDGVATLRSGKTSELIIKLAKPLDE